MNALASIIAESRREREDWRYTDVEKLLGALKLAKPSPAANDAPDFADDAPAPNRFVFINGVRRKDATKSGDIPATILQGDAASGYTLSLAAQNCLVTAPIELVFIGEGEIESNVKLAIDIGANTSLTIIEHHQSRGTGAAMIATDIHLHAQAKLMHKKIMHDMGASAHFARARVRVDEGAYYRAFALIKNAKVMRNELDVSLTGSLAQCGLYGALLLREREHVDVLTRVHHQAVNTTSRQLYKAVVKDQARGVFQGRIKVAEGAQKTDGQQLCRALLLSDQAEMDAKPELEIYADDVACSHGCAIGDLDADAMFYLRTRGLSENEARALLLRAFVDEVIDTVQSEETRAAIRASAERWMNE